LDAPFAPNTTHLPAKKLYRDVKSVVEGLRELRFVEPETPPGEPAQPAPAA
jgi:hypothetical protein